MARVSCGEGLLWRSLPSVVSGVLLSWPTVPPQSLFVKMKVQYWKVLEMINGFRENAIPFLFLKIPFFLKIAFIVLSTHWCFDFVSHHFPKYFDNIAEKLVWESSVCSQKQLASLVAFLTLLQPCQWFSLFLTHWWGNWDTEWNNNQPKVRETCAFPTPSLYWCAC